MNTTKTTEAPPRTDVKHMAQIAEQNTRHPGIKPGKPLPEDFVNPPLGEDGHLCLDPAGNYRPAWKCVKIHKTGDHLPKYQFFNFNGSKWNVQVGVWADVPPGIVTCLDDAVTDVIEMDVGSATARQQDFVETVVERIPRFSYTVKNSA